MAPGERAIHTCLTENELRRYYARELTDQQQSAIHDHLDQCTDCAARAELLLAEHETWVQQLRRIGAPPGARRSPGTPGETGLEPNEIDGYEIIEEINRGGQGIVYHAIQNSTKREVALKVLREGVYASPAARKRFEREIELVSALRHPNIVTVFDSGRTRDGRKYLVMDFVRGQALSRWLRANAPALREQLTLYTKVCKAVNAAHQRGVIHRDLKPSNILVDEDAEPYVLDFGLARQVAEPGGTVMTSTGQVAGTLPYMSPEQARGLPDAVDVRSDVYTLGIMLYEMLTGTYPYPIEGDAIQVLRHIAETPPAPPDRRIDDDLRTIIFKALSKERERRYQTAGELARDVEHYLAGEPIEAKRDSSLYLLKKTLQRYRFIVAISAVFVLLIAISAVALGVMYVQQTRLRAEAETQAQIAWAAETQADRRFNDVRKLANFFILEFDPAIKHLPGSAPARQTLVNKGLEYLDALASDAAGNLPLQRELAAAYTTIGDAQGELQASNLGDLNGALQSYRKAAEILDGLAVANPDKASAHSSTLLNMLKIGDVQYALGNGDAALATYREVIARGERWVAAHPKDQAQLRNLANGHERVGNVLVSQGKFDEALAHYEEFERIIGRITEEDPDKVLLLNRTVASLTHLGQIHYGQGQMAAALQSYRGALEAAETLHQAYPEDVLGRRGVAITRQWLGIISSDMGRHEEAMENYQASIIVLEALLRDAPEDNSIWTDLATTLSKMGETQMALGQREAARVSYIRSTELTEQVAERWPEFASIHRLKGVAYYKMAEFNLVYAKDEELPRSERLERWREARDWLQRCLDVFLDMRKRGILPPTDADVPDELTGEIETINQAIEQLKTGP